jgi:hypothetical protein
MYNYSGLIDPTVSLITANGITISVNTSANVPAPEQYPASVRATGLSDPDRPGTLRYGNGRARAVALFANGLIEFNGFYLNTDGFPSSDKVLQDSDLYHNFSYIVQSEKNLIEFEVPIKNIVHPAGMSLISKTVLKSEEIEATSAESNVHIIMPGPGPDAVTVSNSYSNVIVGFQTIWDPDANSVYYANSKVNVGDLFIIDDGNRVPISRIVTDVVSNTELRIAGDFIYPGPGLISFTPNYAGISGTVTVNPAVDGSVTINAPITGNVLLNPPITGTYNLVNGTANIDSTSIVVGTNTDFGNQLEIGDVIKINNEVRRIDTIGFATLPGTANIAASNVVVGNNTSFVSYVRANDQISVNGTIKTVVTVTNNEHLIVNTAYANTNTDSVIVLFSSNVLTVNSNFATSGNAQSIYLKDGYISAQTGIYLTGNNTTFTTNLVANDIITVNNQVRQVVNVINNTYLQVNSRFYYSGTDNTCFLRSNAIVGNSTLFTTNLAANDIITVNNEIRQVVNVVNATYMTVNAALNNYAIGETVYKRSNVVIGSATNFDPQVNIGDIITVNNEIREVTVVTSDTELEVNVPFTEYATSQSLYKHNTEILGSATSFDTELVANSIIKVNNQIREVIAVTNAVVLTINAPFQYNETGNAISKLQPTELTVSANSSDLNSYLFPGDNISFNIVASNIMMAQTGTVNVFTTNTLVVGTSTSFDTQLVPNNTIIINGQLKLVVNIANATTLNVNSAFTSNLTNKILYKQATYQNANVVSITANVVTTNLEINGSGTNLVYLVDPNYVNIDFVGSVDISGNVVTANTSNAETISSYVGYIYIGNEIIANGETRTVVNVQSNNITVNSDFDNSGDDKYLAVYENHSFNVVTLTAY